MIGWTYQRQRPRQTRGNIMHITTVLPIAFALVLTACGSSEEDADGTSLADATAEIAEGPMPLAGEYRDTTTLLEFTAPGLPADAQAMMQSQMLQTEADVSTRCLTPEQAAGSREDMLVGLTESDCTVQRFDVAGGDIDAALSCSPGDGITGDVTMTGTMGEQGSDMVLGFTSTMPEVGQVTMRMRMVSERIGDCS